MSLPEKLSYIDRFYLKIISRKSKLADTLISYLSNGESADLGHIKDLLSMDQRNAPSRLLRLYIKVFSGYDTSQIEHKIYLIAEYELYYRESQSARI